MARSWIRIGGGLVLAGAVTAAGFVVSTARAKDPAPPVTQVSTGTAEVRRLDVAERQWVNGTLGHAGAYTVVASGPGVLTWRPAIGAVVGRGQPAFEVDGAPVMLLYGVRPAWRAFTPGMSRGADVEQLERNLKALGFGAGLSVDQRFTSATGAAIRRWQHSAHLGVTGTVPLGQVVFLPGRVRIGGYDVEPGTPVQPGAAVEHGTSDEPAVTIQLSPRQLPSAKVGDRVEVILPNQLSRPGTVTAVGAVAVPPTGAPDNAPSAAPVTVHVDGDTTGFLDQASVRVAITVALHTKVLAVPITALNALSGGGYEVVVVDGAGTRRVPVQTGLFDDSAALAEVSGAGLAEGQRVRVPR